MKEVGEINNAGEEGEITKLGTPIAIHRIRTDNIDGKETQEKREHSPSVTKQRFPSVSPQGGTQRMSSVL